MKKTISNSELSLFCYQLYIALKSGLPLVDSMDIIKSEIRNQDLIKVTEEISKNISKGEKLSDSLKGNDIFPEYFFNMIEIAEKTGNLEEQTLILSKHYEERAKTEKKVNNAVFYPTILLLMMLAVVVFLVTNVIPMFSKVLNSVGVEVPPSTRSILNLGLFLQKYGLFILIGLGLIILFLMFYSVSENGKVAFDKLKLSLPVFGELNKKIITSNFSNAMVMMINAGMHFQESLPLVKGTLENAYVDDKLDLLIKDQSTSNLSELLEKLDVFPTLFKRIISLGEKSGELEASFEKASAIYREDVDRSIQRVTSSIEPVLVIILSVIVGVILLSIMIPLINIISEIG